VIDYVIPGNDDAIRSGALLCRLMADAVTEGRYIRQNRPVISKQTSAPANRAALIEESPVVTDVVPETPVDGLADVAPEIAPDDAPELVIVDTLEPEAEKALPVGDEATETEATTESEDSTPKPKFFFNRESKRRTRWHSPRRMCKRCAKRRGSGFSTPKGSRILRRRHGRGAEVAPRPGPSVAAKRADREAGEGAVAVVRNGNVAAMVEMRCETDFVAKSEEFVSLVDEIAARVCAEGTDAVSQFDDQIEKLLTTLKENISIGRVYRLEAVMMRSSTPTSTSRPDAA